MCCLDMDRPHFYLDMLAHFCQNTEIKYEKFARDYLYHALSFMDSEDPKLIEKVISTMKAIFAKLQKESQFALVPLIRESIEDKCITVYDRKANPDSFASIMYEKKC